MRDPEREREREREWKGETNECDFYSQGHLSFASWPDMNE